MSRPSKSARARNHFQGSSDARAIAAPTVGTSTGSGESTLLVLGAAPETTDEGLAVAG